MHEDFQYVVEKFGEPESIRPFEPSELESFQSRVPQGLLTFWERYGLCQFWGGLLRLSQPDEMRGVLKLAFGKDAELDPDRCHVVAYSAFGELYIWSETFQRLFLSLPELRLRSRVLEDVSRRIDDEDRAVAFLFAGEKHDMDFLDKDRKLLYARCRSRLGPLETDECYGFFPTLMLGGEADIDAVRRVKALEHFAILAQIDRPTFVRILADGQVEPLRQIG
ncbi:GAD-like domain-containing protein [Aurantimonas endophytica]|uniref:DUF1851 domain-containing protein n=1 Tax=Aurantimonas endophytica TaxID=1522175 RepID=A0A7W6HDS9_9HYPH|nr:GAD-like domain-containing protein [Aurantimonas endophytica]MBB4003217.1 hypothetical protein [Aurantimonas endophytica]MCO6404081.1 DUF1851 domain-containing protein [Aurantimonas endophytica]